MESCPRVHLETAPGLRWEAPKHPLNSWGQNLGLGTGEGSLLQTAQSPACTHSNPSALRKDRGALRGLPQNSPSYDAQPGARRNKTLSNDT